MTPRVDRLRNEIRSLKRGFIKASYRIDELREELVALIRQRIAQLTEQQ